MDDASEMDLADGSLVKRVRRIIAGVGLVGVIFVGLVFVSQTKNQITVTNNSSTPVSFELETISKTRTPDDDVPQPSLLFPGQTIAPNTTETRAFRVPPKTAIVLITPRMTRRGEVRSYQRLASWGNRITVVEGASRTSTCELTALREWFDANQSSLTAYRKWIPLSNSWWD